MCSESWLYVVADKYKFVNVWFVDGIWDIRYNNNIQNKDINL